MTDAMTVQFVDTHAHLDESAFDPDRDEVVAQAVMAGVRCIVNIGYRPSRWETSATLARRHSGIRLALGLHPHHADEFDADTLDRLKDALDRSKAVAVGEIGFDYHRTGLDRCRQREVFVAQLRLAARLNLPIVIHQRDAEDDLVDILDRAGDLPPVVLHSFEASERLAKLAVDRGYAVGVGGLATRPSSGPLRNILSQIPITSIVLETDSPYLAPAGVKDRRNVPANVPSIAARLAPLWNVSGEELAHRTTETAEHLFRLRADKPRRSSLTAG